MDIDIEKIRPILKEYAVEYAGIFGSHACGEAHENSDIDILIRVSKPTTLSMFIRLENMSPDIFNRPVDLVTERALSLYIRDPVLNDLNTIYGTQTTKHRK